MTETGSARAACKEGCGEIAPPSNEWVKRPTLTPPHLIVSRKLSNVGELDPRRAGAPLPLFSASLPTLVCRASDLASLESPRGPVLFSADVRRLPLDALIEVEYRYVLHEHNMLLQWVAKDMSTLRHRRNA